MVSKEFIKLSREFLKLIELERQKNLDTEKKNRLEVLRERLNGIGAGDCLSSLYQSHQSGLRFF